jgi:succinoglycan biosynthesis protein ExoA
MREQSANGGTSWAIQPVRVSVIIPCRNEADHIEDCVRSILTQQPPSGGFEVIIADGMSTDGTGPILDGLAKEDGRLRVIENPGRIVSTGLNGAIAVARGTVIVRMDAHTLYARDYLRQCLAVLDETGADNVGGPALTVSEGYVQTGISAAYHSPFAVGGARFHNPSYEGLVDTVPYGCWPRTVFSTIGLFDEELVRNQDDEFNLRLTRANGKIWQSPRIKSWYRARGSFGDLFRQYRQYGYWKVRVIQKHRVPASIRHVVPAAFLVSLLTLLIASWWWSPAVWALVAVVSTYAAAILVASILTTRKARCQWTLLPLLPFVFGTYHLSYGLGFMQGVVDFVIMRRRSPQSFLALSRRSSVR